jgi:hypothetical protein
MVLLILALPLVYLGALIALLVRRRGSDVGISLLGFGLTFGAGAWAILQSRASTAGIGFIFLPVLAALSGTLALGYAASRRSEHAALRALGMVALVATAVPAVISVRDGLVTGERNATRDAEQARRGARLDAQRARLDSAIASAGDGAADTVNAMLRARLDDRELVLAALERPIVSAALLDSFARSPDLGIALQAVRNRNTSPSTLESIYRTHVNRMYFLQALAGHANTPPAVIREIHGIRPVQITGLDIWFAGNPSAPVDVLRAVARESDSIHAVRALLQHPALDCAMVESVARGPAVRAHADDADVAARIAEARAARCGRHRPVP